MSDSLHACLINPLFVKMFHFFFFFFVGHPQARSQITGPGGGSLAAFSFPDRNAAGGAMGGAGGAAAADDEEEDLYS